MPNQLLFSASRTNSQRHSCRCKQVFQFWRSYSPLVPPLYPPRPYGEVFPLCCVLCCVARTCTVFPLPFLWSLWCVALVNAAGHERDSLVRRVARQMQPLPRLLVRYNSHSYSRHHVPLAERCFLLVSSWNCIRSYHKHVHVEICFILSFTFNASYPLHRLLSTSAPS